MKSPGSAGTDSDPEAAAIVRLLRRRRGYPPRHRLRWIANWIALLILLGAGVTVLPDLVNGVAYLTGAENSSVFLPLSYGRECGRSCSTVTDGTLASGARVSWPRQVPLGQEFPVREPVLDWGLGAELINDDATAIVAVVLGVLGDGLCLAGPIFVVILARRWGRPAQHGRHARAAGR